MAVQQGHAVFLHVYDIVNISVLKGGNTFAKDYVGFGGAFHAAVQVDGLNKEFAFGGTDDGSCGIWWNRPMQNEAHSYRETIHMGFTELTPSDVEHLIREMMPEYPGSSYSLTRRNCCHFADDLCQRLGVGPIPAWVNRLAGLGSGAQAVATKAAGVAAVGVGMAAAAVLAAKKMDDESLRVRDRTTTGARQIDQKLQLSEKAGHVYGQLDQELKITENVANATAHVSRGWGMLKASLLQPSTTAAQNNGGGRAARYG